MAEKFVSERNLKFLLYEVLDAESLTRYPYFQDHDREVFDMVLETGIRMGKEMLWPVFAEMDREPPELVDGEVRVHPSVRGIMKACGEGGWIGAHFPYDMGGQQMPNTIMSMFRYVFSAANYSASVFPFLTAGAAHLLLSFASKELQDRYLPKMISGEWQGTMALTEPQAGSSLTDLTTTAHPTDKGYYLMKGQKIFISCADHNGVENIVNLMIARIKGAPPGIKGISLFVVPKYRPEENGDLVFNDISCAGIYHKMGYKGSPLTQLAIGENDECRAWLVGEEHKGIRYMFQLMNEARIDVGMSAAAIANAAYYASLEYARERPQGRRIMEKDPLKPQIPIINHADVKRMLMFQRAVVEGALALAAYCAKLSDVAHVSEDEEEKEKSELLLEILTPAVKTYPSEMGVLSVSAGLQCLGGYGFCDEFPLEQHYRDTRIHPIHEGTTGIQGMDLLGRKVVMKNGKAFMTFMAETNKTIEEAKGVDEFKALAESLEKALGKLGLTTKSLTDLAIKGEIDLFLADATLYLEAFGVVVIAWQWLLQALAAKKALASKTSEADVNFYTGKIMTARFFFEYELPKTRGLFARLQNSDGLTLEMKEEYFQD